MSAVKIGKHLVGVGQPCVVVAEIGINHNGFVEKACELIDAAVVAGCQFVKFQKRTIDVVYKPDELAKPRSIPPVNRILMHATERGVLSPEAVTRLQQSGYNTTTNGDLKCALEFTHSEYQKIDQHCKMRGIQWFASPWDPGSVDFLEQFDVPCHKIASAMVTHTELLQRIKKTGKPVIMATGMSTLEEITHAVDILGTDTLVLLHTVSSYPPEDDHLNLRVMETLQKRYPIVPIGYSGHEKDILPSEIAVALGATMIERHLTLDRRMWGSDHAASIEPREMASMVEDIKRIGKLLGDGEKRVLPSEIEVLKKLRPVFPGF